MRTLHIFLVSTFFVLMTAFSAALVAGFPVAALAAGIPLVYTCGLIAAEIFKRPTA
jgi:hypothetical protein